MLLTHASIAYLQLCALLARHKKLAAKLSRQRVQPLLLAFLILFPLGCGFVGYDSRAQDAGSDVGSDALVDAATGFARSQLASGIFHSCALLRSGEVYCWGDNSSGAIGQGNLGGPILAPTLVALPGPATFVSAGGLHSCAVVNRDVYCWGAGDAGKLGNGQSSGASGAPALVTGLPNDIIQVSAGGQHTCAASERALWCWGRNAGAEVGTGNMESPQLVPFQTIVDDEIEQLVTGGDHNCARVAGEYLCWGHNDYGDLFGQGHPQYLLTPSPIEVAPGSSQVTLSATHICMLASGAVHCRGEGGAGQLGNGQNISTASIVPVTGLGPGVTNVSTQSPDIDASSVCAAVAGEVWCWGLGQFGQLGNGSTSNENTPVQVQSLPFDQSWEVAVGGNHACAISDSEEIWCWGQGTSGQLGDGLLSTSTTAVQARSASL